MKVACCPSLHEEAATSHRSLTAMNCLAIIRPSTRPQERAPPPPVMAKPPPPTPVLVSEAEMPEEQYKAPSVSEAKKLFDRPEERIYQPSPAKVPKPSKAPAPPPPPPPPAPVPAPVPPVKTIQFKPREQSPRLFSCSLLLRCYCPSMECLWLSECRQDFRQKKSHFCMGICREGRNLYKDLYLQRNCWHAFISRSYSDKIIPERYLSATRLKLNYHFLKKWLFLNSALAWWLSHAKDDWNIHLPPVGSSFTVPSFSHTH